MVEQEKTIEPVQVKENVASEARAGILAFLRGDILHTSIRDGVCARPACVCLLVHWLTQGHLRPTTTAMTFGVSGTLEKDAEADSYQSQRHTYDPSLSEPDEQRTRSYDGWTMLPDSI